MPSGWKETFQAVGNRLARVLRIVDGMRPTGPSFSLTLGQSVSSPA